jgi:N utilization substance protein B
MLYQWEVGGADLGEVLASHRSIGTLALTEAARQLADTFVTGTARALDRIDPLIATHAANWRLERMAVIDRAILRLGIHELLHTDTPRAVVIDEALELARAYSAEPAVKFINGVLDAVARAVEADQGPSRA